jgi:hypothetical protein
VPVAAKGGFGALGWRVLGCPDYVLVVCELQFAHDLSSGFERSGASKLFLFVSHAICASSTHFVL